MGTFHPSDPNDWHRTQAEMRDWESEQKEKRKSKRRESFRFWLTAILSGVAAVAAVAGVLIQLASMQ